MNFFEYQFIWILEFKFNLIRILFATSILMQYNFKNLWMMHNPDKIKKIVCWLLVACLVSSLISSLIKIYSMSLFYSMCQLFV